MHSCLLTLWRYPSQAFLCKPRMVSTVSQKVLKNITLTSEHASADMAKAEDFVMVLKVIIEKGGFIWSTISNMDETWLQWKCLISTLTSHIRESKPVAGRWRSHTTLSSAPTLQAPSKCTPYSSGQETTCH